MADAAVELIGVRKVFDDETVAVDSLDLAPAHESQLWDYLERAAFSLINTFEQ